jgi:HPt (histidine-containing phosphotransfer) domain-containing protein
VDNSVIDKEALSELQATTDAAFAVELIDTYLQDSSELIEAMRTALADSDSDQLRRAAHSLKSNSATVGAADLSSMAKELEMMGKEGELGGAEATLKQVEAMFERVRTALEQAKDDVQA